MWRDRIQKPSNLQALGVVAKPIGLSVIAQHACGVQNNDDYADVVSKDGEYPLLARVSGRT